MAVRIRLMRFGCRNHPFYRVVAADSRTRRDGKTLEVLGFYNPVAANDSDNFMRLKIERVKHWLSVGAQPTETVESLLFQLGILTSPPAMGRKGRPILNQENPANANGNEDDGTSPEAIFSIGLPVD